MAAYVASVKLLDCFQLSVVHECQQIDPGGASFAAGSTAEDFEQKIVAIVAAARVYILALAVAGS